jgi:3',5'-cyclic AMP phosphodiesterase CpdA
LAAGVRWVHFSDIHVGVPDQHWLWPRFESQLLKDLEVACAKTGGLDVVIFSGDLTQQALPEEFNRFEEIIGRVLDKLETLGGRPQIVTVAGNHDLRRPDAVAPSSIATAQYWQKPELRDRFWNEEGGGYCSFIREVFSSYTEWRDRAIRRGIHVKASSIGLLPGDASYIIDTPAGRLGLVCLNSSWLQLGAGDYTGELHVDTRQILAVTGGHPDDWVQQNHFNLIVTHHPPEWLHRNSFDFWNNDINPAGRFDLHLFGHMHAPSTWSISHGGGHSRRSVQAASLFGLEVFGDGTKKRIQGYSANEIRADAARRTFISWELSRNLGDDD